MLVSEVFVLLHLFSLYYSGQLFCGICYEYVSNFFLIPVILDYFVWTWKWSSILFFSLSKLFDVLHSNTFVFFPPGFLRTMDQFNLFGIHFNVFCCVYLWSLFYKFFIACYGLCKRVSFPWNCNLKFFIYLSLSMDFYFFLRKIFFFCFVF